MSYPQKRFVMVCQHSSCLVQGASELLLAWQTAALPEDVIVMTSGCQGQCRHLKNGQPVERLLHPRIHAE